VRDILLTNKKPNQRPALLRDVITEGAAERGVAGFEGIEDAALGDGAADIEPDLARGVGEELERLREDDADHFCLAQFIAIKITSF
jgi:hypothetical protein